MDHLMRSLLFVSANNPKFIEKSVTSGADALIMDMEDSVPEDQKAKARSLLRQHLDQGTLNGRTVFVRTNELHSPHFMKEIDACAHRDITGFMPPKIESVEDLIFLDKLLTQKENEYNLPTRHFKLAPLIETTASVLNLNQILKGQQRVEAVCFGGEDYLNDLHGTHGHPPIAFETPRAIIAMTARNFGISPIDTPFLDLSDTEGFKKEKRQAYELGFEGSLLINPRQIKDANRCFMPSDEEVRQLEELIEAVNQTEEKGVNYGTLNGRVVGFAKKKRAKKILNAMNKTKGE